MEDSNPMITPDASAEEDLVVGLVAAFAAEDASEHEDPVVALVAAFAAEDASEDKDPVVELAAAFAAEDASEDQVDEDQDDDCLIRMVTLWTAFEAESELRRNDLKRLQTQVMANFLTIAPIIEFGLREQHPRQRGFCDVLDIKSNLDFFRNLRVTRDSFNVILGLIEETYRPERPDTLILNSKKALYITLWYLGNTGTYRELSELFGISESTAFDCVHKIIIVLCDASPMYIKWPTAEDMHLVKQEFLSVGGLPGVIGAVDGCHIAIKAPNATQSDYIDRTLRHSVNLMAVCTQDMKFTFFQAGFPGSAHDSRVFQSTSLFGHIQVSSAEFFPCKDTHIVGDSAFSIHTHVMVPFRNRGNLTDAQVNFNKRLSKGRVLIENSFAFLKGRFRRLKYIDASIDRIPNIIKACCVLHNITLGNANDVQMLENENPLAAIPNVRPHERYPPRYGQRAGIIKRLAMTNAL